MNILRITISAFFIFVMTFGAASAQQSELFITAEEECVVDGGGTGSGLSTLYRANPVTGSAEEIGPIGFRGVTGLVFLGDGRLVGSARGDELGERISNLIEINPITGAGSLIGVIGVSSQGGCGRVPDITYDTTTDTLFGIGFRCGQDSPGDPELITINQTTGEGTRIGPTGFEGGGNGLAARDDGTLFYSTANGMEFPLSTLNPQTGQGTLIAEHPFLEFVISGMDFQPFTGILFGIENGFGDPEPWFLVTVNTENAVVTRIAQFPDCADAMVFRELPPRPVPTLSQWGLIAMAGVLGLVGLLAVRRRVAA